MVVHTCRRPRKEDHKFQASPGKVSETLSQKQNQIKRTGSIVQVVEHLPSMHKTLGSFQVP
jgi:hypothetical protein